MQLYVDESQSHSHLFTYNNPGFHCLEVIGIIDNSVLPISWCLDKENRVHFVYHTYTNANAGGRENERKTCDDITAEHLQNIIVGMIGLYEQPIEEIEE